MRSLLLCLTLFLGLKCLSQDTCQYTFRFSSGEASLSTSQKKSLDSLIRGLEAYKNYSLFYIQGHTDNIGDRSYNVKLSEKRCRSVKKFLLKRGVTENKISLEKFAFDLPVSSNDTENGRADNRRTSLIIITKIPAPDWNIQAQRYPVNLKQETILTTKNGCKVIIPENAFVLPKPELTSGKIEIEIVEYNNPAYFIASGIPMSYTTSGKLFVYHSEEMLSIKALQQSSTLELKDDVKITLNCRKVDSLYETGFYKFNLKEQKWFEDEPESSGQELDLGDGETKSIETESITTTVSKKGQNSDAQKKEIAVRTDTGTLINETPAINTEQETDNINQLKKAKIDTGGFFGPTPKENDEDPIAYACPPNCCDTYFYIKLGKKLSENPIDLAGLDLSRKYLKKGMADPEHVQHYLENSLERLGGKKYFHVKLVTKKLFLRKKATVFFKFDKERNPELKALKKVKWVYRFKDNKEDYSSFETRRFNDLRIIYDSASRTALVKLEENNQICTIKLKAKDPEGDMEGKIRRYQKTLSPRVMSIYSCFWAFNAKYFATEEKKYPFSRFVNYFNSHLSEVKHRYDSLDRNIDAIVAELKCCPRQSITTCSFIPGGGSDSLVKTLIKLAGPNRMLLIGFGLYNYDKVIPLENLVQINNPEFFSANGRKIDPKESFLILGGVNGLIHLDDKPYLNLIANYRNTLFVVDKANRRYRLVLEAQDDIRNHSNVFILEDISSKTGTLAGLERELMQKK